MKRNLLHFAIAALVLGSAIMFGQTRFAKAHGGWYAYAYTPYRAGSAVVSVGRMWVYGWHAAARLNVRGERKVCGFWGCSYEIKATSSKTINQGDTGYIYAYQPCVRGTNRYMTRSDYAIAEPFYTQSGSAYGESSPEFTCN